LKRQTESSEFLEFVRSLELTPQSDMWFIGNEIWFKFSDYAEQNLGDKLLTMRKTPRPKRVAHRDKKAYLNLVVAMY